MGAINQEWVVSEIKKMKAHERERHYVLGVIATELEPFDLKVINKRIITHLRSKLRKYTFTEIATGYSGWKEFKIWGERIDYEKRIIVRIGEFTLNNRLVYSEIKTHLVDRMGEINKFIAKMDFVIEELPVLSRRYENAVEELRTIQNELGSTNRLLKFFPLANELHRA